MKSYYLFKSGKIVGPVSQSKFDSLTASGEILNYSWLIEENNQQWMPIDAMPSENPFQATQKTLGKRTVTGTFMHFRNPLMGLVKGIHSYGLELFLDHEQARKSKIGGLKANSTVQINLLDETNEQYINTEVLFQNAEPTEQGMILRFGWSALPVQI